MDALYLISPNKSMDKPLELFESYTEKAFQQYELELEDFSRVLSVSPSSSSDFMLEAATNSFIDKIKNAIAVIAQRLKEFIDDTRANINRYFAEKKIQEKIAFINSVLEKYPVLKHMKIKYSDRRPILELIENEKKAIKRMVRKKGTTSEELKIRYERYREQKTKLELMARAGSVVTVATLITGGFLLGIIHTVRKTLSSCDNDAEGLGNIPNINKMNKVLQNNAVVDDTINKNTDKENKASKSLMQKINEQQSRKTSNTTDNINNAKTVVEAAQILSGITSDDIKEAAKMFKEVCTLADQVEQAAKEAERTAQNAKN